jgi:hypothetical protein
MAARRRGAAEGLARVALVVLRLLLPAIAFGVLLLIRRAVKPSAATWRCALKVGWVAGLLNLAADTIAGHANLWHYVMPGLIFGLPLDLYIAVALVYGSGVALIYDWLTRKHPPLGLWFAVCCPSTGWSAIECVHGWRQTYSSSGTVHIGGFSTWPRGP